MVELLFFGQLTDITGVSSLSWEETADTDALVKSLIEKYPALAASKFRIAVNNKLISSTTTISSGSKIAFMPPFSGG